MVQGLVRSGSCSCCNCELGFRSEILLNPRDLWACSIVFHSLHITLFCSLEEEILCALSNFFLPRLLECQMSGMK